MNAKRERLLNENLRKLLFKFSLPTVIGMIVASLYNLVDTIFVGKGVGPMAIAAITLVMPIMMVFLAIATMIGMGSASIISRSLGAGDQKRAISTMANAYLLNLIITIPLIVIVYIFKDRILGLFGANEIVFTYASDYLSIVLIGFFFFVLSFISSQIIRAEGMERAAIYPLSMGIINFSACFEAVNILFTLTSKVLSRSSVVRSVISPKMPIAALFTRISSFPNLFFISLKRLIISPVLDRSTGRTSALPPSFSISVFTSFSFSTVRAESSTVAPAPASPILIAFPIPLLAPVTRAILPLRF